jgi:hypothetical protein
MGVINRHIDTRSPFDGLAPHVLNVPGFWAGFPKASASNVVYTASQQTAGSSAGPGTAVDYARALFYAIGPTASSSIWTAGGFTVFGVDLFGSTRSETVGTNIGTATNGVQGTINFARVDTISAKLSFLAGSSTAASNVSISVGVGQKIGLPIHIRSTNAIYQVHQGTLIQSTFSGATSTNNQFTVVTGDYYLGGLSMSNAQNSASLLQINYNNLGRSSPRPTVPQGDRR